jgi:hypothetical protein
MTDRTKTICPRSSISGHKDRTLLNSYIIHPHVLLSQRLEQVHHVEKSMALKQFTHKKNLTSRAITPSVIKSLVICTSKLCDLSLY